MPFDEIFMHWTGGRPLKLIGDENCWIGKSRRIGVFSPDPEHRPAHIRPLMRLNETYPLSLSAAPPPRRSALLKKLASFCHALPFYDSYEEKRKRKKKERKSIPFHCLKCYLGVSMNKLKPFSSFFFFICASIRPRLFSDSLLRAFFSLPLFYSFLSLRPMILPFTPSTFVVTSRFETSKRIPLG